MTSSLPELDWTEIDDRAVDTARVLAMDAVQKVGNGHPGTAMSLAPAAYLLFQKVMRHDPADPHWLGRDRFVLSCGHSSITLYTQLYLGGFGLELDDLKALRTWGSKTPGHPEVHHTAGVETTTGPLGQGVANAVGMAMAARRERGMLDADAARRRVALRPPRLRDRLRRRHRGGRQRRGLVDRRHPAARQPHPDLRPQPRSRSRATPTIALHRGRRQALRGLRLARPGRRLDQRRHGSTVEDIRRALRRDQGGRRGHRPALASSCSTRSSPGPRPTRRAPRQGPRQRPRRRGGRGHQEADGLRPRADLRGARRRARPHPRAARARCRGRRRVGRALTPGGRPPPRAGRRCSHRLKDRTLPDGLGRRAADLRGRREGRRHPQGVR